MAVGKKERPLDDAVFASCLIVGAAMVEAGLWMTCGIGYTLMLNGAVLLFGCWKTA